MEHELLKTISAYTPFLMMTTNGKIKPNITRFMEMAIFAAIMVVVIMKGIDEIKVEIKDIKEATQELREERVRTNERLGRLEIEVDEIRKVVFKPIGEK